MVKHQLGTERSEKGEKGEKGKEMSQFKTSTQFYDSPSMKLCIGIEQGNEVISSAWMVHVIVTCGPNSAAVSSMRFH